MSKTTTNTIPLRQDIGELIFELAIGSTDVAQPFARKLQQVLSIYTSALDNHPQLTGDRLVVGYLVSALLLSQLLEFYDARKKSRILRSTPEERRVLRLLLSAADDLEPLMLRQPLAERETVLAKLPEMIWSHFYEMTADECRGDADAIRALIATAEAV